MDVPEARGFPGLVLPLGAPGRTHTDRIPARGAQRGRPKEFENNDQMAGRDQLTKILKGQGIKIAAGTVGCIMNEYGLKSRRMRAWKKTAVNDPEARTEHIRNHMLDEHGKRDFTAVVPGTRLVGDITTSRPAPGGCIWPR